MGVLNTVDALEKAQAMNFDLVEVAPQAQPPVCKIMDYSKFKYEQDVKAKEARKRQQQVIVKEMKFKPKISSHDYDTKKHHIERFLNQGSKVKITVWFRGREMQHTDLGAKLLRNLSEEVSEIATVETMPKLDGKNMTMVLAPLKRPERKVAPEKHAGEKPLALRAHEEAEPAGEANLADADVVEAKGA